MVVNKHNFKKKYGQNWLHDKNTLEKIVKVVDVTKKDLIIEIGPGSGNLTKYLIKDAKKVIAYEIDKSLKKDLEKIKTDNLELIFDDFLKRDVKKDIEGTYENIYVIANLPYYITTPIITKLIETKIPITAMILMMQKEVGERLMAKPGTKEYNSLTVYLNYYFNITKVIDVSRNSFYPVPNVDSSVLLLERKDNYLELKDKNLFFKLIRDAFQFKRKNIKNNLKGYDIDIVEKVLTSHKLSLSSRAEEINLEIFVNIANALQIDE